MTCGSGCRKATPYTHRALSSMTFAHEVARRVVPTRPGFLFGIISILAGCTTEPVSGPAEVGTGSARVVKLAVLPRSATLETTQAGHFRALGLDSNGDSVAVAVEWTATGGTITPDGIFSSAAPGTFKVIGRGKGTSAPPDTATVVVTSVQAALRAISVSPAVAAMAAGGTQQFSASGTLTDGSTVPLPGASWQATGGTISNSGLYTAGAASGTFSVTAASQSAAGLLTGSASVTVAQPPTPGTAKIDTIFQEGFESGTLAAWQDGVNAQLQQVLTDASLARSGSRLLQITYPAGGDGGWLTRFFMPGYDSIYVRYYVRFEPTWTGGTKLLLLRGSRVDNQWSAFGIAGKCPDGFQWFATDVIVLSSSGDPGPLQFYTYYPGMATEPDGVTCWGRYGTGVASYVPPSSITRGAWHKIEFWVKLNTPGQADGIQRFWLDGVLRGEWRGLVLRNTTDLRLNSVTLESSLAADAPVPVTRHLYVDDVLVTTARPSQ